MSTDITPRDIATELMLAAARDVDALTISERLDETSEPDEADGFAEQVAELIRTADITVGWPATEQVAEADALDLDAIEARANAATRGPWEHGGGDGLVWGPTIGDPVSGSVLPEDADFIAAARADVPALVAEVRKLRRWLQAEDRAHDQTVAELTAELAETRAALDHANRELAGTRADLDSAIQANTAWANQTGQQPQVWAAPAEPTDVTAVRDRTGQLWVCPGRPGNNLWWRDVCGRGIGYEWHQLLQVGPLTPATAGVTA